MKRLHDLVGGEHELAEVAREIRSAVRELGSTGVGGFHITCSDESEHECTQAFQRGFALESLPRLTYGERVPFRIANPGARYEWGAVRIAEDHFATEQAQRGSLAMVVKINGHVAVTQSGPEGIQFGSMDRYGSESVYCGAIHAVLHDSRLPFAQDLRADLLSEGRDRVQALKDVAGAPDGRAALFGALAAARMQARKCVLDIQEHTPKGPTVYVVVHGVTLNKPGPDTELLGGLYVLDHRGDQRTDRYHGLGDDPAAYSLTHVDGRLRVSDPQSGRERAARDHRALAAGRFEALSAAARTLGPTAQGLLGRSSERTVRGAAGRTLLKGVLTAVAATSPTAAALLLAAEGAADIHEVRKLNQAVDPGTQDRHAREVVEAVHDRVDHMSPEVAERVVDALRREFAGAAPR